MNDVLVLLLGGVAVIALVFAVADAVTKHRLRRQVEIGLDELERYDRYVGDAARQLDLARTACDVFAERARVAEAANEVLWAAIARRVEREQRDEIAARFMVPDDIPAALGTDSEGAAVRAGVIGVGDRVG